MVWNRSRSIDLLVHAGCLEGEGMGTGVRWTRCRYLPLRFDGARASTVIWGAVDSATLRSLELRGLPLSHVFLGWVCADLAAGPTNNEQCDRMRHFPDVRVLACLGNSFDDDLKILFRTLQSLNPPHHTLLAV